MTYEESVRFLYSLGNELKTAKFGLENITTLLGELGNPHRGTRFIHVAGTNGKGSTCAMIEAGLRAAGVRTGLYTSPHLAQPTERIQLNGIPVTEEQFAAAFEEVHQAARHMPLHPTYFETVTAMAFVIFAREAELVVLETGLGGRLDATNVVTPELSVLTPIDYDHQFFLGNTLTEIAAEKAGILKPDVPAVTAMQPPEALAIFVRHQPLRQTSEWPFRNLQVTRFGSTFEAGGHALHCPLAGAHQAENARTAAMTLSELGFPPEGIAGAKWPGRLEHIAPHILVDGAHNPAGARALAAYLREFYAAEPLRLIFGAMADKAVAQMAAILFPLFDEVVVTAPDQSRAMPATEIAKLSNHPNVRTGALADAMPPKMTVISGSLFLVAEARALLARTIPRPDAPL